MIQASITESYGSRRRLRQYIELCWGSYDGQQPLYPFVALTQPDSVPLLYCGQFIVSTGKCSVIANVLPIIENQPSGRLINLLASNLMSIVDR